VIVGYNNIDYTWSILNSCESPLKLGLQVLEAVLSQFKGSSSSGSSSSSSGSCICKAHLLCASHCEIKLTAAKLSCRRRNSRCCCDAEPKCCCCCCCCCCRRGLWP
jgi:hypothetical protein